MVSIPRGIRDGIRGEQYEWRRGSGWVDIFFFSFFSFVSRLFFLKKGLFFL
jgi:hypothetical protein